MRGLYTSTCLETLSRRFNNGLLLDIGRAFDLIVGTSTGGILACGLAAGVPVDKVSVLYQEHGPAIFPNPTPSPNGNIVATGWKYYRWESEREAWAKAAHAALRSALAEVLQLETVVEVWTRRNIALCIPTINMATHYPWVFKTPHFEGKTRDNLYTLVDICMATSAAPILFPLFNVDVPDGGGFNTFVDGGLWANNPVLLGLVEALQLASAGQAVEIISIGTCSPPAGRAIEPSEANWGLKKWKAGIEIVSTALDAQSKGYEYIASQLAPNLKKECRVIRLPNSAPSGDQTEHVGMDIASDMACKVLCDLGRHDAEAIHSKCMQGDTLLKPVKDIFTNLKSNE